VTANADSAQIIQLSVIAGIAAKTSVNALLTRQSITLRKMLYAKVMTSGSSPRVT